MYVLSNEWAWALGELKDALAKDGWTDVVSTVDVQLDAEQYYVSMAVDMAIAARAEVFVGNGVCLLVCVFGLCSYPGTVFEFVVQRDFVAISQGNGPVEQSVLVVALVGHCVSFYLEHTDLAFMSCFYGKDVIDPMVPATRSS